MESIRCIKCNKKLAEISEGQISIKCPRCKTLNNFTVKNHTKQESPEPPLYKGEKHEILSPPKTDGFIMPLHDNDDYIKDKNGIIAGFGNRHLFVAQIPRKDATEMIIKHHYSHRIVNNSYIHMGVFMNGDLVGCMQFGYLLNPRAMMKIVAGTEIGEYLELNRMWLSDVAPKKQ